MIRNITLLVTGVMGILIVARLCQEKEKTGGDCKPQNGASPRSPLAKALLRCLEFGVDQGRKQNQESAASYAIICLRLAVSKRPLIFGLGLDSLFYESVNDQIVFVEDNNDWISKIKAKGLQSKVVNFRYETSILDMSTAMEDEDIPIETLRNLLGNNFDFVLIDAPMGHVKNKPGRFQPAKFASSLKGKSLDYVCIHDYNRAIEKALFHRYFGEPDDVLSKFDNMQQLACKSIGL